MITTLTWVSIVAGGILIVLMLLSFIGGLDIDMDIDLDAGDTDTGGGGIGLVKGVLTFVSVSTWVIKMLMATEQHMALILGIGIFSGLAAFGMLNYMFKLLLRNQENVNYALSDALYQNAKVYLKIPQGGGNGIVHVDIKGATRELKALSKDKSAINTGESVIVIDVDGEYAIVQKNTH